MGVKIQTSIISTYMGEIWAGAPSYLTAGQVAELNHIGLTGKNFKGKRTTRKRFLNSLGIGTFDVAQTRRDFGDFTEAFVIARAYEVKP